MRPTEVRLVQALLEHEAESTEDLAKAIIRELDLSREGRDHHFVRLNLAGLVSALGPFNTEHQALLAARQMKPGTEDEVLMRSVGRLVSPRILGHEEVAPKLGTFCGECQHPMLTHEWPRAKVRGCVIGYEAGKPETGCQCGRAG